MDCWHFLVGFKIFQRAFQKVEVSVEKDVLTEMLDQLKKENAIP